MSPFFRKPFKTPFSQPCVHVNYLNIMLSQENWVSHTSDMCELHGLTGCVVEPLAYTLCGGRVSPKLMSHLESETHVFVVLHFWKPGHSLCILYCLSFLELSVDTSLSHMIFQYLIRYFNMSHDISLSHPIIHYLLWDFTITCYNLLSCMISEFHYVVIWYNYFTISHNTSPAQRWCLYIHFFPFY
jgi:hypothetical protein